MTHQPMGVANEPTPDLTEFDWSLRSNQCLIVLGRHNLRGGDDL